MSAERVLVVIPVVGHREMTHALIGDLARERELVDVVVVDNGGDYEPVGHERVLRPGTNLGWAAGTNLGTTELHDHVAAIWLNNDTRLAPGFVAAMMSAARSSGAGIVGPVYDCFWRHQRIEPAVALEEFRPRRRTTRAAFIDGTCMYVTRSTIERIGLLDDVTFAPTGWGAEFDYCFRAGDAGIAIRVSEGAYLRHAKAVTAATVFGDLESYGAHGHPALEAGMASKWGTEWRARAGIEAATGQTAPRRPRRRVRWWR